MQSLVDDEKSKPRLVQMLRDQVGVACTCMLLAVGVILTGVGASGGYSGDSVIYVGGLLPVGIAFILVSLVTFTVYGAWRIARLVWKTKYDEYVERAPKAVQCLLGA